MSAIHSRALALYAVIPRITLLPLDPSTPISGSSPGGATIGAISATAANGLSTAQLAQATANSASANAYSALNGLSSKLEAGSSYVLGGDVTLGSAGHGLYTTGFAGGNGVAFTDNGLVMREGGVTKVAIPTTGSPVFAGALACGNGAYIETAGLASGTAVNDMVVFQTNTGAIYGKIRQGDLYSGSANPGGEMSFNFSGLGHCAISVQDTTSGSAGRLIVSSSGSAMLGTLPGGGGSWNFATIPLANGNVYLGLNAGQLQGYVPSNFASASHTHTFNSLPSSGSEWRRCGTAHWNGSSYDYDEFWIQLRNN